MSLTVTDLFCGAGGSSVGARDAGMHIAVGANHWPVAADVYNRNHPDARVDVADISQADPRRYPVTDILLASPECTNHSQARGVSRKRQDASLFDSADLGAERSRATMWDVVRFAEQIPYAAIVVENVVEATKWVFWQQWLSAMTDGLGYEHRILSLNSMHFGVPQSRDRIFVVFTRPGLDVDLELELTAWCVRCDDARTVRQAWKNGRTVGRYRSQWVWACTACGSSCEPETAPASSIIDWELDCPRIGDRARPLAAKTRARILAGLQRYGWAPITTVGAGNGYETTPGNRARPLSDPLPTQTTTAQTALATPPADGFLFNTAHGGRVSDLDDPHPTICASDDRQSLVITNDHQNRARTADEALPTVTTGNRHALIVRNYGNEGGDPGRHATPVDEPVRTITTSPGQSLVVPLRNNGNAYDPDQEALGTVTAGGNHHGLLMRNNTGAGEMTTPTDEPMRSVTTKGHQSLLMPYYGQSLPRPTDRPMPTVTTKDRCAVIDLEELVDDCGFRMLEPYEAADGMAYPKGYIPRELPKKDQMKLAGNGVTPPPMTWICGRVLLAMGVS